MAAADETIVSVPVEVTIKLVVDSAIDPRDEHGGVPYAFKHMQSTPEVEAFLDHLSERALECMANLRSVGIAEFEVVGDG